MYKIFKVKSIVDVFLANFGFFLSKNDHIPFTTYFSFQYNKYRGISDL